MNLNTDYLGLALANPVVASASPLSKNLDNIRRIEDAGGAALVLDSLFEEEIRHESLLAGHYRDFGTESHGEALDYLPEQPAYNLGPETYLERIRVAKAAVDIPIIASLNGVTAEGWVEHAALIEGAGADALELNIFQLCPDPGVTGGELEERYLAIVSSIRQAVRFPVAVKLSPFFSAPANLAKRLSEAGANGLVLFNRFLQPDFDLETLEVEPSLELTTSWDMRLPLRWVAILHGQVEADLAITSGVHGGPDVLKAMMAGAKVAMTTSELLRNGIDRITGILEEVREWMEEHEYESVAQMRGSMSRARSGDSGAFERANYVKMLHSWRPDPAVRGFEE